MHFVFIADGNNKGSSNNPFLVFFLLLRFFFFSIQLMGKICFRLFELSDAIRHKTDSRGVPERDDCKHFIFDVVSILLQTNFDKIPFFKKLRRIKKKLQSDKHKIKINLTDHTIKKWKILLVTAIFRLESWGEQPLFVWRAGANSHFSFGGLIAGLAMLVVGFGRFFFGNEKNEKKLGLPG